MKWLGFNVMSGEPWQDSWVRRSWLTADLRVLGSVRRRSMWDQTDEVADDQEEREAAQRRPFNVGGAQQGAGCPEQALAKARKLVCQRGLGRIQARARKGMERPDTTHEMIAASDERPGWAVWCAFLLFLRAFRYDHRSSLHRRS